MTVHSADGVIACKLKNGPTVVSGPGNMVPATCPAPSQVVDTADSDPAGLSTNAVVNITGPANYKLWRKLRPVHRQYPFLFGFRHRKLRRVEQLGLMGAFSVKYSLTASSSSFTEGSACNRCARSLLPLPDCVFTPSSSCPTPTSKPAELAI